MALLRPCFQAVLKAPRPRPHLGEKLPGIRRNKRDFPIAKPTTRIDRLAVKGEDTEDAFVDAPKRFLAHESFQGFDT